MASGRCLSGGESASSTTLSTELSGLEIVQHYAGQLQEAGWTRSEPDGPPASFAAAWGREIDGQTVHVVLQAVQHPQRENCFSIRLSSNWPARR
ncbi:MAG: hypothetical protein IH849_13110 [Acidobacteria bacterium]|nr:hypothetical protein [Acidobacteriota bacterium]